MLNLLSRGLRTSKTAKRSASTFAAAKLKELGKPLEITEVKAPKKLEKEQVIFKQILVLGTDVLRPLPIFHGDG